MRQCSPPAPAADVLDGLAAGGARRRSDHSISAVSVPRCRLPAPGRRRQPTVRSSKAKVGQCAAGSAARRAGGRRMERKGNASQRSASSSSAPPCVLGSRYMELSLAPITGASSSARGYPWFRHEENVGSALRQSVEAPRAIFFHRYSLVRARTPVDSAAPRAGGRGARVGGCGARAAAPAGRNTRTRAPPPPRV